MSKNTRGILGKFPGPEETHQNPPLQESNDARRIREFHRMEKSFGARVHPLGATFH